MTELAKCYLREAIASYNRKRAETVREGMKHYTDELMEVVNSAHPEDLPMVLAAMKTVEETVRELPEYRVINFKEMKEQMCRQLVKPVVVRQRVEIRVSEDMYELPDEQIRGF